MTPQEFKAWFQGFTEGLDGRPNEDQWKRIKKRVDEIDGKRLTEYVYLNNYYPYYYPYQSWSTYSGDLPNNNYVYLNAGGGGGGSDYNVGSSGGSRGYNMGTIGAAGGCNVSENQNFDSCSAMYSLGKTEFLG